MSDQTVNHKGMYGDLINIHSQAEFDNFPYQNYDYTEEEWQKEKDCWSISKLIWETSEIGENLDLWGGIDPQNMMNDKMFLHCIYKRQ